MSIVYEEAVWRDIEMEMPRHNEECLVLATRDNFLCEVFRAVLVKGTTNHGDQWWCKKRDFTFPVRAARFWMPMPVIPDVEREEGYP